MTFNQVIWDVLNMAYREYEGCQEARKCMQAIEEYAAACDGAVKVTPADWSHDIEFIPNPIPRY